MSFDVLERRMREKLEEVLVEKTTFHTNWNRLRQMLVEPMLQSAEKVFTERRMRARAASRDEDVVLFVTGFDQRTHRLRFSANSERLQIACGYCCYVEGEAIPPGQEADVNFFALAEMSQLALERTLIEFTEKVARDATAR